MISDEQILEALEKNPNQQAAADALEIPRTTLRDRLHRIKRAARRGERGTAPVLPGFEISKTTAVLDADGNLSREFVQQRPERGKEFALPAGHRIKGVSALVDPDGRELAKWIKTGEHDLDPLAIAEAMAARFDRMEYAVPTIPPPEEFAAEYLNLIPLADLHLGLRVWGRETDGTNWDLPIADKAYRKGLARLISRLPPAGHCVILGGGDLLHADNNTATTPNSGHHLDVDGRYERVLEVAQDLVLDLVTLALQRHDKVTVRLLKGNHDLHATSAVTGFLRGAFRRNERVDVLPSENQFWVHQHGLTMLGATHGHDSKPAQLASIMAARYPEIWGATKHRYGHQFHVHHKTKFADEYGGALIRTHRSPAPQDAWHFNNGFLSGREMTADTYSAAYGHVGTITELIQ